jgi:CHAD domain-containing protein
MSTAHRKLLQECNKSYCRFGSDILGRLLQTFESQIDGVIEDKDVECVHKMRVTSRKIGAVMPFFQLCYPKKKYKKWLTEIKTVTKLLSDARDLDVQIAFLQDYIQKSPERQGLLPLLKCYKNRRKTVQATITRGLKKLQCSKVLKEIIVFSKHMTNELSTDPFDVSSVIEKSSWYITSLLEDFLALSDYVYQESKTLKHHEMRIHVKKLRYTMEAFAPLYKDGLDTEIGVLKELQDLLGEMHDCDVWLNFISKFTKTELATAEEDLNSVEFKQAVTEFSIYVKWSKKRYYASFIQLWDEKISQDFFGSLRKTVNTGIDFDVKKVDLNRNWVKAVQIARDLSKAYLQDTIHSEQVRALALGLFDDLVSVHHLGDYERGLLECAALLHDLGLSEGAKEHHKVSMKIILNDTQMPLTSEERRIVASVVRYHRKGFPKQTHYNLAELNNNAVDKILALSSILRLADALDYLHNADVQLLGVKVASKRVIVECFSKSGASLVEQAFDKKKDFFEKFFKKRTVLIWTQP